MPHDHNPELDQPLSTPREHRAPRNPREDVSVHGKTPKDGAAPAPQRVEPELETAEE